MPGTQGAERSRHESTLPEADGEASRLADLVPRVPAQMERHTERQGHLKGAPSHHPTLKGHWRPQKGADIHAETKEQRSTSQEEGGGGPGREQGDWAAWDLML